MLLTSISLLVTGAVLFAAGVLAGAHLMQRKSVGGSILPWKNGRAGVEDDLDGDATEHPYRGISL